MNKFFISLLSISCMTAMYAEHYDEQSTTDCVAESTQEQNEGIIATSSDLAHQSHPGAKKEPSFCAYCGAALIAKAEALPTATQNNPLMDTDSPAVASQPKMSSKKTGLIAQGDRPQVKQQSSERSRPAPSAPVRAKKQHVEQTEQQAQETAQEERPSVRHKGQNVASAQRNYKRPAAQSKAESRSEEQVSSGRSASKTYKNRANRPQVKQRTAELSYEEERFEEQPAVATTKPGRFSRPAASKARATAKAEKASKQDNQKVATKRKHVSRRARPIAKESTSFQESN